MKAFMPIVLACAVPLATAAAPNDDACKAAFKAQVQPILNTNCVGCHQDASPAGGLSLQRTAAPASLLRTPSTESRLARVVPGDPQNSYVWRKLNGTHRAVGSGEAMPFGSRLSAADLATVAGWIKGCKAP